MSRRAKTAAAQTKKQEVLVHLGEHPTPEAALEAWPSDVEHLRTIGRDDQANKLEVKLERLRELTKGETRGG